MAVEETPPQWKENKDTRSESGAGTYPNQWTYRSPSGHIFQIDDSDGAEHMTIQHRSGAKIQMQPNGEIVIRAHKGLQHIVFGNNQISVTGSHDVTVKGGGSLRVEGDYNMHVTGDHHTTVEGKMEMGAKEGFNLVSTKDIHIAGKGIAVKAVEGNMELTADKNLTMQGDGGMSLGTTKEGADFVMKAGGVLSMGGTTETRIATTQGKVKIKGSSDVTIESTGGDIRETAQKIYLN